METIKVHFENTPNPATLKFNLPILTGCQGLEFKNVQESLGSPLANKIFGFPWTASVYLGPNFLSVTKHDWVDWQILAEPLAGLIQEHLDRGETIFIENLGSKVEDDSDPSIRQIKEILDRDIRPVVALDGGDVVFSRYENQVLYLQMRGSCSGCPSSAATLKEGIEVRFKELMPEIKEVIGV